MPVLGDLIVKIKVEGEAQTVASIQRVNQTATNTGKSFAASNASAAQFFATLARGSGSASTGLANMAGGVKVANTNFLDLIQTVAILGNLFKNEGFKSPFKGWKKDLTDFGAFFNGSFGKGGFKQFSVLSGEYKRQNIVDMASGKNITKTFPRFFTGALSDEEEKAKFNKIRLAARKFKEEHKDTVEFFAKNQWASNYAMKFASATNSIVQTFDRLSKQFKLPFISKALSGLFDGFGKLIGQTAKFYGGVFAVAIPAIVAIGTAASEAADNLEKMKLRITAGLMGQDKNLTSSSALTQSENLLKAYKELSKPSVFTTQQIGEAGQRLEAFGLNSVKVLNTALKLAEVFGGMPDDLEMVTRMFGRMASGDLPDIEVLSRFGLSKTDLNIQSGKMGFGDLVDKQTGKLAGTAAQGLEVLLKIIEDRYAQLYNLQKGTFGPEKASAQEKFTTLLETIGKPINQGLVPILQQLQTFIDSFIAGGGGQAIGEAFASLAKVFQEPAVANFIQQFAYDLLAFLIEAGNEFQKFTRFIAGFYGILRSILPTLMTVISPANGLGMIGAMMSGTSGDSSKGFLVNTPGAFMGNLYNRSAELRKKMGTPESVDINPYLKDQTVKRQMEEQGQNLEEIKNNTARAADALELRKANLGGRGGPLAQLGMGINVNQAGTTAGVMRAALPPSFALLNPVNQLQKSIQMEVFRTTNQQYIRRY